MLQNIMQLASDNGVKQFEVLEQISNNVANLNTVGYKGHRFEQYLMPDGRLEGAQRVDYSQGQPLITRRELDVAVDGQGFIPVTQVDGTVAYTRDGSFAKNSQGYLVTQRGDIVGDGIQLPLNYQKVMIAPDGTVNVMVPDQNTPQKIGKLSLLQFNNPEGLKSVGYNKLVPTDTSGPAEKLETSSIFKQGMLERSNISMFHQIDQILRLNAGLISNLRVVKFTDDIYRQSVNLRQ